MTNSFAEIDAALDRVIAAAHAHLAAIKAADGEPDDDAVWNAYVALNNASYEYDERLNDVFGEVTPWDLESISADQAGQRPVIVAARDMAALSEGVEFDDPYPYVISVRQRRDYHVPSVRALARAAQSTRAGVVAGGAVDSGAVDSADLDNHGPPPAPAHPVVDAIIELIRGGDGSLAMLDVPELEPLDGVVIVAEVNDPLRPDQYDEADALGPFRLAETDRLARRLDERTIPDLGG